MLECMPICGLSHVLHGEVSRDNSKILDVGQTHDSNDENAQWCFTRFSLQGTRGIQINGVMASYCSCSKRLSSDLWDLLTSSDYAEFTQYAPCIGDESCLTEYHQSVLRRNLV